MVDAEGTEPAQMFLVSTHVFAPAMSDVSTRSPPGKPLAGD